MMEKAKKRNSSLFLDNSSEEEFFFYNYIMSNSSSSSLITTLALTQLQLTRYVYPVWLIFGITGCLLNLFIFSRRKLRNTTCCICKYFSFPSWLDIQVLLSSKRFFRRIGRSSDDVDRWNRTCSLHSEQSWSSIKLPVVLQTARLSLPNLSDAFKMVRGICLCRSVRVEFGTGAPSQLCNDENDLSNDRCGDRLLVDHLLTSIDLLRNSWQSVCHPDESTSRSLS